MSKDGPGFRDDDTESALHGNPAHGLPGTLPPAVRENLKRAAANRARPPADPLGTHRRRWLRRLVGWLARRFEAAALSAHRDAAADRHYAALLRRLEGDMLLREAGAPGPEAEAPDMGRAVGLEAAASTGDGSATPTGGNRRPTLRVVK
ncbi:hypothetical protein C882_0940 [Caenispirillum salinarum AK4]|uniref:Uncharacterized protein n=1 Tax=Caenispirillum salinarum AK4 TaxID=1238182 RepID=K9HE20_9PROT|nr:hypothetical protein [Caenispirillum salinarum]EKV28728.1 hypothetical protein C882_0940 [Caenispirillum salinarum AK4]